MAVKGVIIHNWCVKSPINLAMVIIYPSIYSPCSFLSVSCTIIIISALVLHVAPEFPLSNIYSLLITPLAFYYINSEWRTSCDQITLTNSDKSGLSAVSLLWWRSANMPAKLYATFSVYYGPPQSPLTPLLSQVGLTSHWYNVCNLHTRISCKW